MVCSTLKKRANRPPREEVLNVALARLRHSLSHGLQQQCSSTHIYGAIQRPIVLSYYIIIHTCLRMYVCWLFYGAIYMHTHHANNLTPTWFSSQFYVSTVINHKKYKYIHETVKNKSLLGAKIQNPYPNIQYCIRIRTKISTETPRIPPQLFLVDLLSFFDDLR